MVKNRYFILQKQVMKSLKPTFYETDFISFILLYQRCIPIICNSQIVIIPRSEFPNRRADTTIISLLPQIHNNHLTTHTLIGAELLQIRITLQKLTNFIRQLRFRASIAWYIFIISVPPTTLTWTWELVRVQIVKTFKG